MKFNFKKIEKYSFWYWILSSYAKFWHDQVFYKQVKVVGKENIPKDKPIVLAPNHQNALMDAAAPILGLKRQIIFVARADIFNKPLIIKILLFLKILPIFRIRDGKEKLELNELIFKKTVDIFENKKTMGVFPEGMHNEKRFLLPLKKGIPRMVFPAEAANDFNLDIQILPVGLYYSNFTNYRSKLLINVGEPIAVKDFEELYRENEPKAMLALRDEMQKRIRSLIIHNKNGDDYQTFEELRNIYDYRMAENMNLSDYEQPNKLKADQETIAMLEFAKANKPEVLQKVKQQLADYQNELKNSKLRDWLFKQPVSSAKALVQLLLLFPGFALFLPAFFIFAPVMLVPEIINKRVKDQQFHSSFRFAITMVVSLVMVVIAAILIGVFSPYWWAGLPLFVVAPLAAGYSLFYYRFVFKVFGKLRYKFSRKKREKTQRIRKELIDNLDKLYAEYQTK